MRYRTLGRTGEKVSEIGFGGTGVGLRNYISEWDPSGDDQIQVAEQAIERAIALGITYFDTAPKYGSEALFGRMLKPYRERVFIATKVRESDADSLRRSIEESLTDLQTNQIDLMQYHGEWYTDEDMHNFFKPDGILAGLRAVHRDGLVRFIGFTSEGVNGNVSQLIATGEFDVMQIQYNLFLQHPCDLEKRHGVMFEAEAQEMGIVIMRAMTGGTFTKWMNHIAPVLNQQVDFPKALLSFVLSNPMIDVALVDMRQPQWVEANCTTSDDLSSRIDLTELYRRFS